MSELRAACAGCVPDRDGWPSVSVVLPIRNEAADLERAVASVLDQDYPGPLDVCLAVAPSTDGTADVARRLAEADPRIAVVDNPAGVTPAGLNAAIRATAGTVVVRVDGHAHLSPGYIRTAVATMCRTGAVNVGGRQVPEPTTPFEAAVAAATTSWMGTGGATYRVGGEAGAVDTVYLGVFDRAAGDRVGWFDETLVRNQDYEFNIRLRSAGGVVWFDPALWVGYRPRGSWMALARQYFEYGCWKAEVVRRHPGSLRLRQVAPAAATAAVALSVGAAVAGRRHWLVVPVLHAAACSVAGRRASSGWTSAWLVARVLLTMQLAWGSGAIVSALRGGAVSDDGAAG